MSDSSRGALIPPAVGSTSEPTPMTDGGSCDANTSNSGPKRTASKADLRDHAVRLMKRRKRYSLRRCCERQREGNSDQPDHSSLPCFQEEIS